MADKGCVHDPDSEDSTVKNIYGEPIIGLYSKGPFDDFIADHAHAGLTDAAAYMPPPAMPAENPYSMSLDSGETTTYKAAIDESYRNTRPQMIVVEVPVQSPEELFQETVAEDNSVAEASASIETPEYIPEPMTLAVLHPRTLEERYPTLFYKIE